MSNDIKLSINGDKYSVVLDSILHKIRGPESIENIFAVYEEMNGGIHLTLNNSIDFIYRTEIIMNFELEFDKFTSISYPIIGDLGSEEYMIIIVNHDDIDINLYHKGVSSRPHTELNFDTGIEYNINIINRISKLVKDLKENFSGEDSAKIFVSKTFITLYDIVNLIDDKVSDRFSNNSKIDQSFIDLLEYENNLI